MIVRKSIEIYEVTARVYYKQHPTALLLKSDVINFSVNAHDFNSLCEKLKDFNVYDLQSLVKKGEIKDYTILKIEYAGFKYYFD